MYQLARVYRREGKSAEAEALLKAIVAAEEKTYGQNSVRLIPALREYASLLRETGQTNEAERVEQRAQEISGTLKGQPQFPYDVPPGSVQLPFGRGD